jgi:hypothetical protein
MGGRKDRRVDPAIAFNIDLSEIAVLIAGTASLPDGTVLRIGAWNGRAEGPFDNLRYAQAIVLDGAFLCRFDLDSAASELVSASVVLRADE